MSRYLDRLKNFILSGIMLRTEKGGIDFGLTDTPDNRQFNRFREIYHNESLTELVKNLTETHRIIEHDGKLIKRSIQSTRIPILIIR